MREGVGGSLRKQSAVQETLVPRLVLMTNESMILPPSRSMRSFIFPIAPEASPASWALTERG